MARTSLSTSLTMVLICIGVGATSLRRLKVRICLTSCSARSPASSTPFEVVVFGGLRGHVADDDLGVADDGRQDVVEVVGHAAGQGAEGLHLLGLQQLPFELLAALFGLGALGDVDHDAHQTCGSAVGVVERWL